MIRFGPKRTPPDDLLDLSDEWSEADRVERATEIALDLVDRGDSPHLATRWAAHRCDVAHRTDDVTERVLAELDDDMRDGGDV